MVVIGQWFLICAAGNKVYISSASLRRARPFVLDVSVPHPYSGSGDYKPSAMQDTYTSKRSTHGQAYESQGYSNNFGAVLYVVL